MIHDKKQSMKISLATHPLKNEWADNREQPKYTEDKQTRGGNRAVALRSNWAQKKAPCWKKDSSKDSDSCFTFDKNLGEALLLPDHALVRCVIRQVALVDSECPLVAHAFKHIPGYARGRWGKIIQGGTKDKTRGKRERDNERKKERKSNE